MLDWRDRARLVLKDCEFRLSPSIQRAAHSCLKIPSPYLRQDDELKAVFVHVPKAAGTSVRKALYGLKSFHIPAIRYQIADPERFRIYFKFCFVRNPWDRIQSAFRYLYRRVGSDPSFPDHRWATEMLDGLSSFSHFLDKMDSEASFRSRVRRYIHFRDQLDWIAEPGAGDRRILVDYVGKYETLEHDFGVISSKLNSQVELPYERRLSDGRDFRREYSSSRMVEIVGHLYRADLDAFGYSFE